MGKVLLFQCMNIIISFFLYSALSLTNFVDDKHAALPLQVENPSSKIEHINIYDEIGTQYDIKSFEGQIVILYFWASWCQKCQDDLQYLDKLKSDLLYENINDVEILPISIDFKQGAFLRKLYQTLKIQNLGVFVDTGKKITQLFDIQNVPYTVILNKNLQSILQTNKNIKWHTDEVKAQIIALRGGAIQKY